MLIFSTAFLFNIFVFLYNILPYLLWSVHDTIALKYMYLHSTLHYTRYVDCANYVNMPCAGRYVSSMVRMRKVFEYRARGTTIRIEPVSGPIRTTRGGQEAHIYSGRIQVN